MIQAALGAAVLMKSHLQCLFSFLPSMDAPKSTKEEVCKPFPSTRAVIGSFSCVRPYLKLLEVNSSLSNLVKSG